MDEQTDNLHTDGSRKRGLFPRIIRKRTVGLKELCRNTAAGTTFSAVELEAAATMLVAGILRELGEGNNVCLEQFGTFSVSAQATRKAEQPHDIRAESIRLKRIVFKTSAPLLKRNGFEFRRMPGK
jgi:predicted histone-like DNA-binding protein